MWSMLCTSRTRLLPISRFVILSPCWLNAWRATIYSCDGRADPIGIEFVRRVDAEQGRLTAWSLALQNAPPRSLPSSMDS
jgi:hypothetical protein